MSSDVLSRNRLETVGRLAAGVAHDFANALGIIIHYADFVAAEVGDHPQAQADVDEIKRAAQRAAQLARQIVSLSKEHGAAPCPTSWNDIVGDLSRIFTRTLGHDIVYAEELDGSLPNVVADRVQLEQVLTNLVLNARDALGESGGHIVVSTRRMGSDVVLTVADDGPGMQPDVAARAFEPFFTTKGTGTGLGLATVRAVVERAGGVVTLQTAPGGGTTFRVTLPAAASV